MKKRIAFVSFLLIVLLSVSVKSQDLNYLWKQKIGDQTEKMRITHVKNYYGFTYVGGTFTTDSIRFGHLFLYNNSPDGSGTVDFFIAIYDDNGIFQTAFKYSGPGNGAINDLEVYHDCIYVLSHLNEKGTVRPYLLKFNKEGNFLNRLVIRPKNSSTGVLDIMPDDNGHVVILGFSEYKDFYINDKIYTPDSAYEKMRFLLKLNHNFEIEWLRSIPKSLYDPYSSTNGKIFKTGLNDIMLSQKDEMVVFNTSGEIISNQKWSYTSFYSLEMVPTSDGGYYQSGNFCSDTLPIQAFKVPKMFPGQNAVFIIRYDRNHNPLWARIFEANEMLVFTSLSVNKNDQILLKVYHHGQQVFFDHEEVLGNMFYEGNDLICMDQKGSFKYAISCIPEDAVYELDFSNNLLTGSKMFDFTRKGENTIQVSHYWALSKTITEEFYSLPDNQASAALSVFPNPSDRGVFTLNPVSDIPVNISVYTLEGRIIYQSVLSKENREINLSGQPKGIYMLKTGEESGRYVKLIYR